MNKNEKKNKITYQLSLSHLYYNDCSDEEFLEDQETLEELQEEEKEIAKKELEQKKVAIKQQIACKREELAKRKEILAAGEHLLQTASSTSSLPSGAHCANQDLLGLSRRDFLVWRRSHPGPKSKWAFRVWARNGDCILWSKSLPYLETVWVNKSDSVTLSWQYQITPADNVIKKTVLTAHCGYFENDGIIDGDLMTVLTYRNYDKGIMTAFKSTLLDSKVFAVSFNESSIVGFQIKNIQYNDPNKYRCEFIIVNVTGNKVYSSANTTIKVLGPPNAPKSFIINPLNATSLLLIWSKIPQIETGTDFKNYQIEYYIKRLGVTNTTTIIVPDDDITLADMQYSLFELATDQYFVTVYGVNIYGKGSALTQTVYLTSGKTLISSTSSSKYRHLIFSYWYIINSMIFYFLF